VKKMSVYTDNMTAPHEEGFAPVWYPSLELVEEEDADSGSHPSTNPVG